MPPAKQPRQPHLKEVPRPRSRSTKPKFDIAVEPAQAEPSASWVYRAEDVRAELAAPPPPPSSPPQSANAPEVSTASDNPFLMVGEGLFLISLGTMKLTYYAARGLIVAPIRLAARLLT